MRMTITALTFAFAATAAHTQTLTAPDNFVGCLTEESFDEFLNALDNQDNRQIEALWMRACFPLDGLEFSVISKSWTKAQIRVYVESDSVLLWTSRNIAN